jgi:hypothetical protein
VVREVAEALARGDVALLRVRVLAVDVRLLAGRDGRVELLVCEVDAVVEAREPVCVGYG